MKRNIIKIDEEKCNGCGLCITDCAEGALKIVNGKAKLVKEALCDGIGACLGKCPQGALTLEFREAGEFDETQIHPPDASVRDEVVGLKQDPGPETAMRGTCPGTAMRELRGTGPDESAEAGGSELANWPIQLKLLNPGAPYLKDADIVIAADCVGFSFPRFHKKFLKGKVLIILCPKLDGAYEEYVEKLAHVFGKNDVKSVTTVHMEVPCCAATTSLVEEAVKRTGKALIIRDYTISLKGELV